MEGWFARGVRGACGGITGWINSGVEDCWRRGEDCFGGVDAEVKLGVDGLEVGVLGGGAGEDWGRGDDSGTFKRFSEAGFGETGRVLEDSFGSGGSGRLIGSGRTIFDRLLFRFGLGKVGAFWTMLLGMGKTSVKSS